MKVLQLVTTLAHGGAQATVLASCAALPDDIEMVIAAGADDTGEGSLRGAFDDAGVRLVVVPHLRRSMAGIDEFRALRELIQLIRAERPDVVHTHSSKAGALGRLAAARAGVPVVHTVHGWSFNGRGRLASGAIIRVERALARLTRSLVVVSDADARTGLGHGIGAPSAYATIRAGIDLSVARHAATCRGAIRAELGLDPATFVVGTVARLDPAKDIRCLVEGFVRSGLAQHGARLVVVGEGPERPTVEAEIERHGVGGSVALLGHRPDGARLVAAFDCFALTSRWEGLPRALVEAMAAGVPVVATPVGGVGELLEAGTGLLVPAGSPSELGDALRAVAGDREAATRRAQRAQTATDAFSEDEMRRQLVALWRRSTAEGGTDRLTRGVVAGGPAHAAV